MTNLDRVPQRALSTRLEPRLLHARIVALRKPRRVDGVFRQEIEKTLEGVRAERKIGRKLPEKRPELAAEREHAGRDDRLHPRILSSMTNIPTYQLTNFPIFLYGNFLKYGTVSCSSKATDQNPVARTA